MTETKTLIKNHFSKIRQALDLREKLLLRQIEVLTSQYKNRQLNQKIQIDQVDFVATNEDDLLDLIRTYGKFNIENFKISDLYESQDYISPEKDHELMYKSFHNNPVCEEEITFDSQQLDNKKIIKDKCNLLNESIINMTLSESKELIEKSMEMVSTVSDKLKKDMKMPENQAKNKQNNENIDNTVGRPGNQESNEKSEKSNKSNEHKQLMKSKSDEKTKPSKLKRNEPTTSSTKKTLKNISNLTLNNCCNGIINLRNISNLTINNCKSTLSSKSSKSVEAIANNNSSNCDSSAKPKLKNDDVECGFYQRLINENKLLKNHIIQQSLGKNFQVLPGTTCVGAPIPISSPKKEKEEDIDEGTYSINTASEELSSHNSLTDIEDGFPLKASENQREIAGPSHGNQKTSVAKEPKNFKLFPESNLFFPLPDTNLNQYFPEVSEIPPPQNPENQESKPKPALKITLPDTSPNEIADSNRKTCFQDEAFDDPTKSKMFPFFMPSQTPTQGFEICFMEFSPAQHNPHPIQVQHWLKQIILETETEPNQNAEILEFSDLN